MKRIATLILSLFIVSTMTAQRSGQEIVQMLNQSVSRISTLQCDFTQTKHMKMLGGEMVSRGIMRYSKTDKLRWEYKSPYQYIFILNGTKVYLKKDGRSDVIDTQHNKMFKQIAQIMMSSVVGNFLTNTRDYKASVSEVPGEWVVTLTPLRSTLKQMFTQIVLHFGKEQRIIGRVELHEKNGDNTVIELHNVKLNQSIPAHDFAQ